MPIEAKIFPKEPTPQEVEDIKALDSEFLPTGVALSGRLMYLQFCYRMTKFNNELEHLDPITAGSYINIGATRLYHELEKRFFANPDDGGLRLFFKNYLIEQSCEPDKGDSHDGRWKIDILPNPNKEGAQPELKLTPEPIDIYVRLDYRIYGHKDPNQEIEWRAGYPKYYPYKIERVIRDGEDLPANGSKIVFSNGDNVILQLDSCSAFSPEVPQWSGLVVCKNIVEGRYDYPFLAGNRVVVRGHRWRLDRFNDYVIRFGTRRTSEVVEEATLYHKPINLSGPYASVDQKPDGKVYLIVFVANPVDWSAIGLVNKDGMYAGNWQANARGWTMVEAQKDPFTDGLFQLKFMNNDSDVALVYCEEYGNDLVDDYFYMTGNVSFQDLDDQSKALKPLFTESPSASGIVNTSLLNMPQIVFDASLSLFNCTISFIRPVDRFNAITHFDRSTSSNYVEFFIREEDEKNWFPYANMLQEKGNFYYFFEYAGVTSISSCELYSLSGDVWRMDYREIDDKDERRLDFWLSNSFSDLKAGLNSRLLVHRGDTGSPLWVYTTSKRLEARMLMKESVNAKSSEPNLLFKVERADVSLLDVGKIMNDIYVDTLSEKEYTGYPSEYHNDIIDYAIDSYFESTFFQSFGKYSMKQGRQDYQEAQQTNSRLNKLDAVPPNRFRLK